MSSQEFLDVFSAAYQSGIVVDYEYTDTYQVKIIYSDRSYRYMTEDNGIQHLSELIKARSIEKAVELSIVQAAESSGNLIKCV